MPTERPITITIKLTPVIWLKVMKKGIQDLQCNNLENEMIAYMLDEINYLIAQRRITNV